MKHQFFVALTLLGLAFSGIGQTDISFQNELQRSIDRGIFSLKKSQTSEGYWTNADHPAVTSIVLLAYYGNPKKPKKSKKEIRMETFNKI